MARRGTARTAISPAAIPAIAVAVLCLLPFVALIAAGVSLDEIPRLLSYPNTLPDIGRTIALTVTVSLLCAIIGTACALLVVRTDLPARKTLTALLTAPLAIPMFVSGYAAYSANLVFAPLVDVVTTFPGASLIMALALYPYVFLAAVVAIRDLDPAQQEVAASLRSRPVRTFVRVTLPQLRPALAGSLLIVALHVLSEYGAAVQLRQRTLTTTIVSEMLDFGDYAAARSFALVLSAIAIGALLVTYLATGRSTALSVGSTAVRMQSRYRLAAARVPALVLVLLVPIAAVGPTLLMTVRGLGTNRSATALVWGDVAQAAIITLGYAAAAGLVATVAALPIAWWVTKRPSALSHLTERSVWLAHSIPNAILALSLVFLAARILPLAYKTPALLVVAYVVLFLPLAVANQRVGLRASSSRIEEAAAALGSTPWQRFRRVTLPLAFPGIAVGALLVALDASKELTTTLMLLPFNTKTLATGLWATTNGESVDFSAAAPYALLLVILGMIPVALIAQRTLRHIN